MTSVKLIRQLASMVGSAVAPPSPPLALPNRQSDLSIKPIPAQESEPTAPHDHVEQSSSPSSPPPPPPPSQPPALPVANEALAPVSYGGEESERIQYLLELPTHPSPPERTAPSDYLFMMCSAPAKTPLPSGLPARAALMDSGATAHFTTTRIGMKPGTLEKVKWASFQTGGGPCQPTERAVFRSIASVERSRWHHDAHHHAHVEIRETGKVPHPLPFDILGQPLLELMYGLQMMGHAIHSPTQSASR